MTSRRLAVPLLISFLAFLESAAYSVEIADSFRFPLDAPWQVRRGFAEDYIQEWCGYHLAEDVHAPAGTQVFAAATGVIEYADDTEGIGGAIHILHTLPDGSTVITIYYHLRRTANGGRAHAIGEIVHKGDPLGVTSSRKEDYGEAPHLHFGVRPGPYLSNLDPRTKKWFYPGYTAIYINHSGPRQCDVDPERDRTDPIHDAIVDEWARPTDFINTHLQPPLSSSPTFAPKLDKLVGPGPLGLAVADFDGDQRTDIAVAIYNGGNGDHLSILHNIGTAGNPNFDLPIDVMTGRGPEGVAAGDLNNDGKMDLVTANADSQNVSVLRNFSTQGFIDFQPVLPALPMVGTPHRVVIADFDSDGRPDLIVTSNSGRLVSVFHHVNDPNTIAFDYRRDFGVNDFLNDLAVADIDRDTKPDILVPRNASGQLTILQNTSSQGNVQAGTLPPLPAGVASRGIAVGDLNGDLAADIVVSAIGGVGVFRNSSSPGVFDLSRTDLPTGTHPDALAIGDLDKDGRPDVVAANPSDDTISVLQNASAGGPIVLTPLELRPATGLTPINLVLEDVDRDGWLDIVVANHDGDSISIILNTSGQE